MQSAGKVKIGIYMSAILMMGVIGISSSLSTIAARFPELDFAMIISLISIPCLVVIPVTLIAGKLMDIMAKKTLVIIGIILFIIGGVAPAFMENFYMILVSRGVIGIGIGLIQVLCSALVAENFEGSERDKVQGNATAAQMLGCIIMSFVGGWLGSKGWNMVFYVHLIAVLSLIGAIAFLPYRAPVRATSTGEKPKIKITAAAWGWIVLMFIFFIGGQIYSNSVSFLVAEKEIGTAAESGMSLSFFAFGGFVAGLIFGKLAGITKRATISVGFILLAISYLIMAFAPSMGVIYLGSFICGLAFSIAMPCMFVGTANSVDPVSVGMAIAIATCAQNFSMFLCPFIANPIGQALGAATGMSVHQMTIIFGAVLVALIGIGSLLFALKKPNAVAIDAA